MMRYVLLALPVVIFPFTVNFPGVSFINLFFDFNLVINFQAVLCYWATSNIISLVQVAILKIPKVRAYFKIEPLIKHSPEFTANKKGFVKGFKECKCFFFKFLCQFLPEILSVFKYEINEATRRPSACRFYHFSTSRTCSYSEDI